jgi:hypothetical protein
MSFLPSAVTVEPELLSSQQREENVVVWFLFLLPGRKTIFFFFYKRHRSCVENSSFHCFHWVNIHADFELSNTKNLIPKNVILMERMSEQCRTIQVPKLTRKRYFPTRRGNRNELLRFEKELSVFARKRGPRGESNDYDTSVEWFFVGS